MIPWKDLHKVFIETNKYKLKGGSQSKVQNDLQGFNRNTGTLSESVKKKKKESKIQNSKKPLTLEMWLCLTSTLVQTMTLYVQHLRYGSSPGTVTLPWHEQALFHSEAYTGVEFY